MTSAKERSLFDLRKLDVAKRQLALAIERKGCMDRLSELDALEAELRREYTVLEQERLDLMAKAKAAGYVVEF